MNGVGGMSGCCGVGRGVAGYDVIDVPGQNGGHAGTVHGFPQRSVPEERNADKIIYLQIDNSFLRK